MLELLAIQYEKQKKLEVSISYMSSAMKIRERTVSRLHPTYQDDLWSLARLHTLNGDSEKARSSVLQRLAIVAVQHGTKHEEYARCLLDAAGVIGANKEVAKAKALVIHAKSILKESGQETSSHYSMAEKMLVPLGKIEADRSVLDMLSSIEQ